MLVQDGQPMHIEALNNDNLPHDYIHDYHPRTAVGLSRDERTLILMVVDGRQPNYSDGASLAELANLLVDYGAYSALNFDGGGSAILVIEDEHGNPMQLGSSIHNRIPARERPSANFLGIYAKR